MNTKKAVFAAPVSDDLAQRADDVCIGTGLSIADLVREGIKRVTVEFEATGRLVIKNITPAPQTAGGRSPHALFGFTAAKRKGALS